MKSRVVLLLGFTVPQSMFEQLSSIDPLPAIQTHNFAWSLARALNTGYDSTLLLSSAPVQRYPLVPKFWFRGGFFKEDGISGRILPFSNALILRHITRFISCLLSLPWILRRRIDTVFIHGVHTPFLLFGAILRLFGICVVPILTDPPGVVLPTDGRVARRLKSFDVSVVNWLLRRGSGIIALAPQLALPFLGSMPVLVLPGILNQRWVDQLDLTPIPSDPPKRPIVLYAGGLLTAYGVDHLVGAAVLLPDVDFIFYGKGDLEEVIANHVAPNVTYKGFADMTNLAKAMLEATILVNARPTKAGFASRSFPSKLIEYLATGRTVLTTRLESIPSEIEGCFRYIDDDSAVGIAHAIKQVLSSPSDNGYKALIRSRYGEEVVGNRIASTF